MLSMYCTVLTSYKKVKVNPHNYSVGAQREGDKFTALLVF